MHRLSPFLVRQQNARPTDISLTGGTFAPLILGSRKKDKIADGYWWIGFFAQVAQHVIISRSLCR